MFNLQVGKPTKKQRRGDVEQQGSDQLIQQRCAALQRHGDRQPAAVYFGELVLVTTMTRRHRQRKL